MGAEKYCLATLVFVAIASIIGSSYQPMVVTYFGKLMYTATYWDSWETADSIVLKDEEFQNLDFRFANQGIMVDEHCVAVRGLPGYEISHIVTGQYVPNQGRTWEGTYIFAR